MTYLNPENLVISDETMAAYKTWVLQFHKSGARFLGSSPLPDLFSSTACKLLASGACENNQDCATCGAAQSSLDWAREQSKKSGILQMTSTSGLNIRSNETALWTTDELGTSANHTISLQIESPGKVTFSAK